MTKDDILTAVAREYGVPEASIMSHCRTQPLAEARQMAMYLFQQEINLPKIEIARCFSQHHTTAIHGINQIGKLLTIDRFVKGRYDKIMNELRKEA